MHLLALDQLLRLGFRLRRLAGVSAKKICTLRPARVLLRSLRKRLMPSSICRPPAASGPVRTVRKPTLSGSCAGAAAAINMPMSASAAPTMCFM